MNKTCIPGKTRERQGAVPYDMQQRFSIKLRIRSMEDPAATEFDCLV
jgi:hypothetical protein